MQRPVKPTKRFWSAYSALYGNGKSSALPKPTKPTKPRSCPPERVEHIAFANWLRKKSIAFYHPANGGKRSLREGAELKLMGVSKGIADVVIPIARKSYHGLYIELKPLFGGVVTKEQRAWIDFLNQQGYLAVVCKGFEAAKAVVMDYFGWKDEQSN